MYVICFGKTPVYLRTLICFAKKCELSVEIQMEIWVIEKSEKLIATKL